MRRLEILFLGMVAFLVTGCATSSLSGSKVAIGGILPNYG
jgi:hypothetical protein